MIFYVFFCGLIMSCGWYVLQVMHFEVVIFLLLKYAKFIVHADVSEKINKRYFMFWVQKCCNLNGQEIAQFAPKKQEYTTNGMANN